jgi:hypothetical protein
MTDIPQDRRALERRNLRTGLVVGALAITFFIGFIAKMWLSR